MKNFKSIGILSFSAITAFPLVATANPALETHSSNIQVEQTSQDVSIQKTQRSAINNLVEAGILTKQPTFEDSRAIVPSSKFVVKNDTGASFVNHTVPAHNLTQVESRVEVIRTYKFDYGGVTYENKIVAN